MFVAKLIKFAQLAGTLEIEHFYQMSENVWIGPDTNGMNLHVALEPKTHPQIFFVFFSQSDPSDYTVPLGEKERRPKEGKNSQKNVWKFWNVYSYLSIFDDCFVL